jgi:hypothetical protein
MWAFFIALTKGKFTQFWMLQWFIFMKENTAYRHMYMVRQCGRRVFQCHDWTGAHEDCQVLGSAQFWPRIRFIRSKLTTPSICVVCLRALKFQEFAQNNAAPVVQLERARLRTLQGLGPETDWNSDWRRADFRPQPGGTPPTLGWFVIAVKPSVGGEGQQGVTAAKLLTKICQNGHQNVIFWCHDRSSKRFGWQNKYFLNLIHKNFDRNLTSKLASQLWPHPVQLGFSETKNYTYSVNRSSSSRICWGIPSHGRHFPTINAWARIQSTQLALSGTLGGGL